jgi:hypothetical protein
VLKTASSPNVGINCPNIRRCIQIWPKKNSIVGQKWRFASKNQGNNKQSILIPFYRQDVKMGQQKKNMVWLATQKIPIWKFGPNVEI